MILHCTAKLLNEMGITKAYLDNTASSKSPLDSWYAHLFFVARRKCVIFTHVKTYYSFVAYDVQREDIRRLDGLFRTNLGRRLYEDEFSQDAINKALKATDVITYGCTSDRHVIGVMNQMIFEFRVSLDIHGLEKANGCLPRSPHTQGRGYIIPIEEMWPILEDKYPISNSQARKIAEQLPSQKKRHVFVITGQRPPQLTIPLKLSEPCWYVFYEWADEPKRGHTGKTICISRATGAVLYDEGNLNNHS